jgi:hypothetical protein
MSGPGPAPATARPTGVTILAVLAAIGGVFGILGGIALVGLLGFGAAATGQAGLFGIGVVFGILFLALGIANLAFAFGAWTLQPWAWSLGIIIQATSIIIAVVSVIGGSDIGSQIIGVAIAAIILYYLMQPNIRAVFGK